MAATQMTSFTLFANMLMPLFDYIVADKNEERIQSLSKVMGIRYSAKIFMNIAVGIMFMFIFILPINIFVASMLAPNFDLSLLLVCTIF